MHELIDDTLELSAIESGNVQVRAELVELAPIVNDVLPRLRAKSVGAGNRSDYTVAPEAMVYADARRLEQMFANLVENGIKLIARMAR